MKKLVASAALLAAVVVGAGPANAASDVKVGNGTTLTGTVKAK